MTELEYYISLGYTEKQAKRIEALTFEEPRRLFEESFFRGAGGMRVGGPRMLAKCMAAPAPECGAILNECCVEERIDIEDIRSDSYDAFEDARFKNTADSPCSDFRATNNTAAATVLLNNFTRGTRTSHDMVRTEELMNLAHFDLKEPSDKKFELTSEFSKNEKFLFLGIKGATVLPSKQNIVLLIDTSGSMCSKTQQIRAVLATVFAKLKDGDTFSLVTYSDEDHTFINGMKKDAKHDIDYVLDKIKKMYIDGCTNGSKGIETAYDIIEENFEEGGVNRVILVTDGDLNFGITDNSGLKDLILKKKQTGAYLSCIGTGLYNLQDDKLETLAKNGNGNYIVLNSLEDCVEVLRDRYESLVYPIARNVKVEVEFNPAVVKGYRLLGFENRMITREDFANDAVISEPFGSGSHCVACYELLFDGESRPLKYQKQELVESDEVATVLVRYQNVENDEFNELSFVVRGDELFGENSQKAKTIADVAETLRSDESVGKKRKALRKYAEVCGLQYDINED